jgi:ribosome-binding protein aMBF1 (putative translation factor)
MGTNRKMFASLPSTYVPEIRRQSMGRLFGFCIQEARKSAGLSIENAARLSGMESSEWMAIEDGNVPQETNRLRAMAEVMEINFDRIVSWVLVCRGAWEV